MRHPVLFGDHKNEDPLASNRHLDRERFEHAKFLKALVPETSESKTL